MKLKKIVKLGRYGELLYRKKLTSEPVEPRGPSEEPITGSKSRITSMIQSTGVQKYRSTDRGIALRLHIL
jgi:hypothetical protein